MTNIGLNYLSLTNTFEQKKSLGRLGPSTDQNKWLAGKVLLDADETSELLSSGTVEFIETKLFGIQLELHAAGQRLMKPTLILDSMKRLVVKLTYDRTD